ncbi:MAG TPA: SOS response-associated peptidase family protein, partial [Candidatus Sulfotelmatobacter sp.]|nr:SOS response-associated peptidase family protein [Candidatus Sulfotelmatobacter sp.]
YQDTETNEAGIQSAFTILTCAANATLATIHDRMPVILSDRNADEWINPGAKKPHSLKRLLKPTGDDVLLFEPASPLVNSVRNEGPQLLGRGKIEQQLLLKL